ncbi:nuclear transport factor 2 family protein [Glaciihabitans sp. dw_435]|uniref:nuclear transport factor 2 family protein n=1 Tax=Glaciihabitans sp. dw_435 TaxID=2720081 RepID=UPI001BD457EE|nr:nuclear transport factor 2 family protein [Glaciihabitans sp. dw_435]
MSGAHSSDSRRSEASAFLTGAEADVAEAIADMYGNLGNRPGFDAHLHADVTVWESADPRLLRGLGQLDELRGPAPAPDAARHKGPAPFVAPTEVVVDVWDDTAVARYVLVVDYADDPEAREHVRVTDVLRLIDEQWIIVHHHAQDLAA